MKRKLAVRRSTRARILESWCPTATELDTVPELGRRTYVRDAIRGGWSGRVRRVTPMDRVTDAVARRRTVFGRWESDELTAQEVAELLRVAQGLLAAPDVTPRREQEVWEAMWALQARPTMQLPGNETRRVLVVIAQLAAMSSWEKRQRVADFKLWPGGRRPAREARRFVQIAAVCEREIGQG